ncbi:MAG: hypothetical protein J7L98_05215 [Candidatus Verstraetearchaeota archaeon]|nr:hypothetical protein [Candidatus Verstraetearchaeota archaeon]
MKSQLSPLERQLLHHLATPQTPSQLAAKLGHPVGLVEQLLQGLAEDGFLLRRGRRYLLSEAGCYAISQPKLPLKPCTWMLDGKAVEAFMPATPSKLHPERRWLQRAELLLEKALKILQHPRSQAAESYAKHLLLEAHNLLSRAARQHKLAPPPRPSENLTQFLQLQHRYLQQLKRRLKP